MHTIFLAQLGKTYSCKNNGLLNFHDYFFVILVHNIYLALGLQPQNSVSYGGGGCAKVWVQQVGGWEGVWQVQSVSCPEKILHETMLKRLSTYMYLQSFASCLSHGDC